MILDLAISYATLFIFLGIFLIFHSLTLLLNLFNTKIFLLNLHGALLGLTQPIALLKSLSTINTNLSTYLEAPNNLKASLIANTSTILASKIPIGFDICNLTTSASFIRNPLMAAWLELPLVAPSTLNFNHIESKVSPYQPLHCS